MPNKKLTVEEIANRVEFIRAIKADYEQAHSEEDDLWGAVSEQIAEGEGEAAALAKAALETRKIGFARHCA